MVVSCAHLIILLLISPAVLLPTTVQLMVVSWPLLIPHLILPTVLLLTVAAYDCGVMCTFRGSSFNITNNMFANNSVADHGGVMVTFESLISIASSTFTNNSAAGNGGVIGTIDSSFNITSSTLPPIVPLLMVVLHGPRLPHLTLLVAVFMLTKLTAMEE